MKRSFAADAAHALMCLLVATYAAVLLQLCIVRLLPAGTLAAAAAFLFLLLLLLSRRLKNVGITCCSTPAKLPMKPFLLSAALCFSVLLIYLAAYYPGGLSSDSITQWHEAKTMSVSDWHPALHTLLIALLMRIIPSPTFILVLHMLAYALSVGYACAVCLRWGAPRILCVLITLYLSFCPAISNLMTFLWKDCAFAISAMVLAVQLLQIHLSRGAWLEKHRHVAAFSVTLALASILRHNGLALTLPAIVWLFISFPKLFKRLLAAAVCFALLFTGIRGPLYRAFDVIEKSDTLTEVIGVPMVVLSHIYVEAPESLDEQSIAFLSEFGTWEAFCNNHRTGDWNDTKWYVASPSLDGYTLAGIAGMAVRAALTEPQLAVEALSGLLDMPLLPFGDAYWRISPHVTPDNWFGFTPSGIPILGRILNGICRLSAHPALSWLSWRPGVWLLAVMLFCALLGLHRPLSALTLPAMLICYNLVTCMVLSSPTDFRFFLSTPLIAPLCLLGLLMHPISEN